MIVNVKQLLHKLEELENDGVEFVDITFHDTKMTVHSTDDDFNQSVDYGWVHIEKIDSAKHECSVCKKKILEGILNEQNDKRYCSTDCLYTVMTEKEYNRLNDEWVCYWTKF